MLSAKSLGNMAAPADRAVRSQGVLEVLSRDFIPLYGFALTTQQCWTMIVPMDFSEGFMAVDTYLPLIPAIDDGPN